ncbi:unnamed protein product [Rotaria socialis]|uniref:Uncharacterized protein n=2 Tax=Rotaria socialis TaxID=392032 RepID=A0A820V2S8_9BILA|nr:unnamed protein product [Rotaria socialis]CAF3468989.1 unnamed protein product [Rotaria socialis]CAF4363659.1 unnamed protein product [Rotaria socialis]CAF4494571.1 unnamed protein product [Rotaria socialis]CAF4502026.1 unnamed protein product [Rotaria socialis]
MYTVCPYSIDRLIVHKYFQPGLTGGQFFRHVKQLGITRNGVYRTISRLRDTGSMQDRPRTGRPRTCIAKERIKRIREKIRRNPERFARKLAMEEDIDNRSMRRILQIDLGLKPYQKRKLDGLSTKQTVARLKRCKALLAQHGSDDIRKIVFSDEKLFVVQQKYKRQNDRIYALSIEDIPEMPNTSTLYSNNRWIFPQDSAPAHKAKSTQQWLVNNCPNSISSEEWPASSPNLNPLDYSIWGTLEAIVNAKPHHSLESLKRILVREWNRLPVDLVRAAIDTWRRRLALVVKRKGGRFEVIFSLLYSMYMRHVLYEVSSIFVAYLGNKTI